ncbi:MAG TPA: TonB-dependent receptor [Phenylobacterium sp.]|nr:TonB-dependent receptor [Phenylobacterium sp.]
MRFKLFLFLTAGATGLAGGALAAQNAVRSSPVDVREVVVTAAPFAVAEDELITNVDVVGAEALAQGPPGGLGDVLNGMPGVRTTAFGAGASRPVIRGLAGPRVQVLTNGVGLIDASALSPDHQVASDPAEAERIEVLRGPSALRYGGSAIGGVVNIIDERIPTRAARGGADGRVSAQGSTVDDGRAVSGQVKIGEGPLVVSIDGTHRESDDYKIPVAPESRRQAALEGETPEPADRLENSAVNLSSYGVGASWLLDNGGFVGVAVKRTTTDYGVPGHSHEQEHEHDHEHEDEHDHEHEEEAPVTIDLEQTRYDFRGELPAALGPFEKVQWSAGYADYEHVELEGEEVGTRFLSDGFEGRLELVQRARDGWEGAVGVQALRRNFDAVGEEAYVPKTRIEEVGAFTVQRVDRDSWGFEGGLRLDRRDLDSLAGQRDFTNVSASAGLFTRPTDGVFLGVSIARNARAPTEAELFANGPHAATRGFEVGDPELDSEVAYSIEGSAHFEAGRFSLDGHVFAIRYQDFIDLAPTGEEEDGLAVFQYVQTDAKFWGFELEGQAELWRDGDRRLRLEGAADWVRGSTDLGPPARIPPWSATARLVYASDRLDGRLEVRRVGEQDRVADFELPTDAYTQVNLFGAFKPVADRDVRVFAEVRNLTDEEIREHASFLKDIAPQPGRNFRLGVSYAF